MTSPVFIDPADGAAPDGHPLRPDGSPYPFGGYAYIRKGCRCAGCREAQLAASRNRAQAKRTNKARQNIDGPTPLRSVVGDLADAASPAKPKSAPGGATAAQLAELGAQLLVYGTIGLVWLATRNLELADAQIDALAMSDGEARGIIAPIARLTAGSKLNSRYGRQAVDNSDVLTAGFSLFAYAQRVTTELGKIRREQIAYQQTQVQQVPHFDPAPEGHPLAHDEPPAHDGTAPAWAHATPGYAGPPGAGVD